MSKHTFFGSTDYSSSPDHGEQLIIYSNNKLVVSHFVDDENLVPLKSIKYLTPFHLTINLGPSAHIIISAPTVETKSTIYVQSLDKTYKSIADCPESFECNKITTGQTTYHDDINPRDFIPDRQYFDPSMPNFNINHKPYKRPLPDVIPIPIPDLFNIN